MRWSKLQSRLYSIIDPEIDFQIHCVSYRMQSQRGSTDLPRYWITLHGETIFDYPRNFLHERVCSGYRLLEMYPYITSISEISCLIKEYIDTPKELLLSRVFDDDYWGLINILRAADRRLGARRLRVLKHKTHNRAARKIIALRLRKNEA